MGHGYLRRLRDARILARFRVEARRRQCWLLVGAGVGALFAAAAVILAILAP